jgi:hypothetical protein
VHRDGTEAVLQLTKSLSTDVGAVVYPLDSCESGKKTGALKIREPSHTHVAFGFEEAADTRSNLAAECKRRQAPADQDHLSPQVDLGKMGHQVEGTTRAPHATSSPVKCSIFLAPSPQEFSTTRIVVGRPRHDIDILERLDQRDVSPEGSVAMPAQIGKVDRGVDLLGPPLIDPQDPRRPIAVMGVASFEASPKHGTSIGPLTR